MTPRYYYHPHLKPEENTNKKMKTKYMPPVDQIILFDKCEANQEDAFKRESFGC